MFPNGSGGSPPELAWRRPTRRGRLRPAATRSRIQPDAPTRPPPSPGRPVCISPHSIRTPSAFAPGAWPLRTSLPAGSFPSPGGRRIPMVRGISRTRLGPIVASRSSILDVNSFQEWTWVPGIGFATSRIRVHASSGFIRFPSPGPVRSSDLVRRWPMHHLGPERSQSVPSMGGWPWRSVPEPLGSSPMAQTMPLTGPRPPRGPAFPHPDLGHPDWKEHRHHTTPRLACTLASPRTIREGPSRVSRRPTRFPPTQGSRPQALGSDGQGPSPDDSRFMARTHFGSRAWQIVKFGSDGAISPSRCPNAPRSGWPVASTRHPFASTWLPPSLTEPQCRSWPGLARRFSSRNAPGCSKRRVQAARSMASIWRVRDVSRFTPAISLVFLLIVSAEIREIAAIDARGISVSAVQRAVPSACSSLRGGVSRTGPLQGVREVHFFLNCSENRRMLFDLSCCHVEIFIGSVALRIEA